MATESLFLTDVQDRAATARPRHVSAASLLSFVICTGLPLGLFGLVNLGAEAMGYQPLFFAPFGLPGWLGAAAHLALLPLLGASAWCVLRAGSKPAAHWLAAFIALLIGLPFAVAPLDSLALCILVLAILLVGFGTLNRVAAASRAGAWLMAPALLWLGVSALLGMAMAVAWSPPFALIQSPQAPAA